MSGRRPVWLVVLLVAAGTVELVHAAGWWRWSSLQEHLAEDAESGAQAFVDNPWLGLPSTAFWSRRLVGRQLAGAEMETVSGVFRTVGAQQQRWMPSDPEGLENGARAAILDGDLDAAVTSLEAALVRDPTSPYLHRLTAILQRQTGRPDAFLEHMATATAIAPSYNKPAVELTPEDRLWIRREGMRRRLALYPRDRVKSLLALAEELRKQDRMDEAVESLREVEHHPDVQLKLAAWEMASGEFESTVSRATLIAERASMPSRTRARAWSLVARAQDLAGNEEEAVEAADQALRLAPSSPAPYLALASLAERRKDHEAALQHLRRAWGIKPTEVNVLVRMARAAERSGNVPEARRALERAVELEPQSAAVAARLVEFQLRNHEYMEATMALSDFLERFPTDARLLRLTDRLRREVSRFEGR